MVMFWLWPPQPFNCGGQSLEFVVQLGRLPRHDVFGASVHYQCGQMDGCRGELELVQSIRLFSLL